MNILTRPSRAVVLNILQKAIAKNAFERTDVISVVRQELKGLNIAFPTVKMLWTTYRYGMSKKLLPKSAGLEHALRVKDTRTDSGVAPITVLTKPYPCPGKCVYCPTEDRMPKSYISSEPAAARALTLKFDPYDQVVQRCEALEKNGHESKKIELIIKGGTWSSYTWKYREWFVKRCFDGANHLGSRKNVRYKTLRESQDANESAQYRIIGLTIETRPDWVTSQEIIRLRYLGCTRVELGVQTLQDSVLALTQRGHTIEATIRATALLKQAGFKVDFHILPGQPGSTPAVDLEDFRTLFADARYRPDMIKLYPCVVLPTAELHEWAERGEFKALEGDILKELLISMQILVPKYCRISRLIRDFPSPDISYGNKITNLRTVLEDEMRLRGIACQCLRCREVGHVAGLDPSKITPVLFEEWYESTGGKEVFITMEDPGRKAVFAFLRLRLPPQVHDIQNRPEYQNDKKYILYSRAIEKALPELRNASFVRELHTYGTALNLRQNKKDASQHKGYGRLLMKHAEKISKREGYKNIAVISGIGVREYYRTLGYRLRGSYMLKKLNTPIT